MRTLTPLLFMLAGVGGTLLVQDWLSPTRMAFLPSPDGAFVFVVDRAEGSLLGWPACRTFRICILDRKSGRIDEVDDGSIYVQHEYESGGIDMTNMKTYWRGDTAVADFGVVRLERKLHNDQWELKWDPSMLSTQPTTQPATMPVDAN